MIIKPQWSRTDPRTESALVHTEPDVLLRVRSDRLGVERVIYAVFHWAHVPSEPLILTREHLLDCPGALQLSKMLAEVEWNENHVASGELEVLREMLRWPRMTSSERAAVVKRRELLRSEARERAAKIIAARAEQEASKGQGS